MPVSALKAVSKAQVRIATSTQRYLLGQPLIALQNGVGAFIRQCRRLDFHYCDWAGSSKGMK